MALDINTKHLFKKFDTILYGKETLFFQENEKTFLKDYLLTKRGWLYIMVNEDHNFLKIGRTTKTPMQRAKSLSNTGVLSDYEIKFCLPSYNQIITEKMLFTLLKKYRFQGEFFSCSLDIAKKEMIKVIKQEEKSLSTFFDLDLINTDINLIEQSFKF